MALRQDGTVLRLKGQGAPGLGSGPAGDALVELRVRPHKHFRREGDDIVLLCVQASPGRSVARGSSFTRQESAEKPPFD